MEVDILIAKRIMTISLSGELDEYTAEKVRNIIDARMEKGGYDTAVFDLKYLSFMDSTGIGMLIGRYKRFAKRGARVFIKNPCTQVEKVLRMTGVYDIMPKITNSEVI